MRTRERSLVDPLQRHGALARQEYGVKTLRELDDETRVSLEQITQVPSKSRPRVTGSLRDGTALMSAIAVLARQGIVVDETDVDPDSLPPPYVHNAGIRFIGVPPTFTGSMNTTITGTGGTRAFNDATDNSGRITIVTGTGVSAAGKITEITFNRPKQNADYQVFLSPADSDAALAFVYSDFATRTTDLWMLYSAANLPSSTSLHWSYLIVEIESI